MIVDQLSLSAADSGFAARAGAVLADAGWSVRAVPAGETTVEAYRRLPSLAPDLLVLRVHAARIETGGSVSDDVALFTGELVDLRAYDLHGVSPGAATAVAEELERLGGDRDGRLAGNRFSAEELAALIPVTYSRRGVDLPYFGLKPSFVRDHLVGRLPMGSTVILMGCDGLRSPALARAFVARGASTFVSWDAPVSLARTDEATLSLIEEIAHGAPNVDTALERVMTRYGPDPQTGARLVTYPYP